MFQAIILAFSTYSKIPTPRVKWDEKNMRFSMCAFPLVGVVIGIVYAAVFYLISQVFGCQVSLAGAVLTVLPVLITGGIHMDGLLDTVDARASYKPMEEKLRILKDAHTGAFAVIYGIVYTLLYFGLTAELVTCLTPLFASEWEHAFRILVLVALGFVYERILSGLAVVLFRKAKKDGMAASVSRHADKPVVILLFCEAVICASLMCILHVVYGGIVLIIGLLMLFYYRHMAYKTFGGITGDLAGYFLQMCEIFMLAAVVVVRHIQMLIV